MSYHELDLRSHLESISPMTASHVVYTDEDSWEPNSEMQCKPVLLPFLSIMFLVVKIFFYVYYFSLIISALVWSLMPQLAVLQEFIPTGNNLPCFARTGVLNLEFGPQAFLTSHGNSDIFNFHPIYPLKTIITLKNYDPQLTFPFMKWTSACSII